MTTEQRMSSETITVNRAALRQLMNAITGPSHYIRELQYSRGISELTGVPNPIDTLLADLNDEREEPPAYTDDLELRYAEACEERDHLRQMLTRSSPTP